MSWCLGSEAPEAPPGTTPTYPAEWNPILLEDDGRDKGHLVPQEGVAALGAPGEEPWSEKTGISVRAKPGPGPGQLFLGSSFRLLETRA